MPCLRRLLAAFSSFHSIVRTRSNNRRTTTLSSAIATFPHREVAIHTHRREFAMTGSKQLGRPPCFQQSAPTPLPQAQSQLQDVHFDRTSAKCIYTCI